VDEAVTALLELLAAHDIGVDFLGDANAIEAYPTLETFISCANWSIESSSSI